MKMAPVIADRSQIGQHRRMPDGRHTIIHTGQHYDRMMSQVFLEELGVPEPDHMLGVGSASHAVQTARVMERIEPVLEAERPELLIVPGDVNSTLAATLVAVKLGIPVAHLEAGLRSFDRATRATESVRLCVQPSQYRGTELLGAQARRHIGRRIRRTSKYLPLLLESASTPLARRDRSN